MPQDKCLASLWNLVQGEFQALNIQINNYHEADLWTWRYWFQEETYKYDRGKEDPPQTPLSNIFSAWPPQKMIKKIKVKNLDTEKGKLEKKKKLWTKLHKLTWLPDWNLKTYLKKFVDQREKSSDLFLSLQNIGLQFTMIPAEIYQLVTCHDFK